MAGTFIVPQSGGAITISSAAAGFTQNSANQYYLNSGGGGGTNPTTQKFTFTFADGASFYITDLNNYTAQSQPYQNVVGIPSTADTGYGSTKISPEEALHLTITILQHTTSMTQQLMHF